MLDDGWLVEMPRPTNSPLVRAFAISLLFHLLVFATFKTGQRFGMWEKNYVPSWFQKVAELPANLEKALQAAKPPEYPDMELTFVEVNPAVATPEAPDQAKYYSSRNALAANPEPKKDTLTPEIDGKQVHVVKTESVPKAAPVPVPAPVTPPPPTKEPEVAKELAPAEAKPKTAPAAGDLTAAKPDPKQKEGKTAEGESAATKGTEPKATPRQRPRTLAQVQPPKEGGIPGEKMKQEGGVKRPRIAASLDTKATPFGAYDEALIAAIQSHWWALIDEQQFARDAAGMVVVQFRLYYDGSIRVPPQVIKCTVGDLLSYLCQRAVSDPAPFTAWPSDMRNLVGRNYRDVTFTFIYE